MPFGWKTSSAEMLNFYRKSQLEMGLDPDDWNREIRPVLRTLDDVQPQPLVFLWPGRIPIGKLTLITGTAGVGKSLVVADLAARLTTGRDWPDRQESPEARVLLVTPDRGTSSTHAPRLIAAGADLSRIDWLGSVDAEWLYSGEVEQQPLDLACGLKPLATILDQDNTLCAVVIDPLSEFLRTTGPAAEIARRRVLQELTELAARKGIAIVCVESAPILGRTRVNGVRDPETAESEFEAVWGVVRDASPENSTRRRLFVPVRNHHGDDRRGLAFEIHVNEQTGLPSIAWSDEEVTMSYPEAIGRVRHGKRIWSFSQTALAESWLSSYLSGGPKLSVDIFTDARKVGLTEMPLRTAMRRVAVKTKQGNGGGWSWSLAENEPISRE